MNCVSDRALYAFRLVVFVWCFYRTMAPRRRPARERETPEGFVRAEDVQRLVQEAHAAGQVARQEQTMAPGSGSVEERSLEDRARDLEYDRYSKCLDRFQKMRPPSYGGEPDPVFTDGWVLSIEKMLEALRCPREF